MSSLPLRCKKGKILENPPKAPNETLDLVLCVQIQVEIFQCMKDTVRSWQASVFLHCMVSAPFPATELKQSKQIKVLQGITSQNTACVLHEYNIYKCQKSRGSGDLAGL